MKKLLYKIFMFAGDRLWINFDSWGREYFKPNCRNIPNLKKWRRVNNYSKRELGLKTPYLIKPIKNAT